MVNSTPVCRELVYLRLRNISQKKPTRATLTRL